MSPRMNEEKAIMELKKVREYYDMNREGYNQVIRWLEGRSKTMTRIKVNFVMNSCDSELGVALYVNEKGYALLKRIAEKVEEYPREGNHPCNHLEVFRVARGD